MIERYHDRDCVQDCTARAARAKLREFATHKSESHRRARRGKGCAARQQGCTVLHGRFFVDPRAIQRANPRFGRRDGTRADETHKPADQYVQGTDRRPCRAAWGTHDRSDCQAPHWTYTTSNRSTIRTLYANCPTCSRRLISAMCRRSCIAPSIAILCITSFGGSMKPDVLRKASGGDAAGIPVRYCSVCGFFERWPETCAWNCRIIA
jgi:hypothetical protein